MDLKMEQFEIPSDLVIMDKMAHVLPGYQLKLLKDAGVPMYKCKVCNAWHISNIELFADHIHSILTGMVS